MDKKIYVISPGNGNYGLESPKGVFTDFEQAKRFATLLECNYICELHLDRPELGRKSFYKKVNEWVETY